MKILATLIIVALVCLHVSVMLCVVARTALGGSLGGIFFFAVMVGVTAFLIYSRLQRQKELNNLEWLATWDEIHIHKSGVVNSTRSISGDSDNGITEQ